jgi:hypothetical protein
MKKALGFLAVLLLLFLAWEFALQWYDREAEPGTGVGQSTHYLYQNLIPTLPVATRFDFPLKAPDGEGTYLLGSFGEKDEVGEYWSVEPGRTQGPEPVMACADGLVLLAENLMSDWGHVVIVVHRLSPDDEFPVVETLYAGLGDLKVVAGDRVLRGQWLGSLPPQGSAALRLEIRTQAGMGLGPGTAAHPDGWIAPTPFIQARRK